MRNPSRLRAGAVALLLAVGWPSVMAQSRQPAEPTDVVVLGASLSAGFADPRVGQDGTRNRTVRLERVLTPLWPEHGVKVRDRSDLATFFLPVQKQTKAVEAALRDAPDPVVAIDFLLWFGYGHVARSAGQSERDARLALQRQGLELLARFECPVLVGDYPDMHGADPQMLAPGQIPDQEILDALNAGVREWARERQQVCVFPLADYVARVKSDGEMFELEDGRRRATSAALLQSDRLHPTRLGMALLGAKVGAAVRELLVANAVPAPEAVPLAKLIDAADAQGDVAELEIAKPETVKPESKGAAAAPAAQPAGAGHGGRGR
jgi:hypothetical protein